MNWLRCDGRRHASRFGGNKLEALVDGKSLIRRAGGRPGGQAFRRWWW